MTTIREEMWNTRAILLNFAVSDLRIRYRNSALGIVWSLAEPLLMLGVLFFVFSTMFRIEIEAFPIYLLLGLVTWNFFKNGTSIALGSLTNRASILTQIYFPRAIPGLSAGVTASLLLLAELAVLGVFMAVLGYVPPATILYLVPIFALELVLILGVSLPLSVLNVKFKDVEFIWGVVLHAGFFLTPIFYRFDMLPEAVRDILQLSPMVQIVTMAHHVTLYGELPPVSSVAYAVASVLAVAGAGYLVFRRLQSRIVEEM